MKKLQLKGLAFTESDMLSKEEKKQLMGGGYICTVYCPYSYIELICIQSMCVPLNPPRGSIDPNDPRY